MKILIVSDTHGRTYNLDYVIAQEAPFDYFIHLGDVCDVYLETEREISCPKTIIAGNNDFFGTYPKEAELELAGKRIWLNHGHRYGIHYGTDFLKKTGREMGVDIVMCGHSHVPVIDIEDDIMVLNPGSLTFPRQENRTPSYIVMEINEAGEVNCRIRYLSV